MYDISGYMFTKIEPITKGWSKDKKYCVTNANGVKYLLRIAPSSQYESKKSLFELQKQVSELGVPMCIPIDFGNCNAGVYTLQSWIYGEDFKDVLLRFTETEQYLFGIKAGEALRLIHSITAPQDEKNWATKYNQKIDKQIAMYKDCDIQFLGDNHILTYLTENRHLLETRQSQCFQHGDYHIGNMMLSEGELIIIDFDRNSYGDPWEEFNRIVFCKRSPHFSTGMLRGYFGGEPPKNFFETLMLYIATNTISSIPWAIPFGEADVEFMRQLTQNVLIWFDNMNNPVPTWYLKDF